MSIYRFSNASLVDEIVFTKTENGGERAYLHAVPRASRHQLRDIMGAVQAAGWESVPFTLDNGKPALEIRGFDNEKNLLKTLADAHFVRGNPGITETTDDHIPFVEKLKKRTLQTSGAFYLAGDAAFTTYGYKEAHWEDMLAGLAYFAGTSSLLAFGRNDQSDLQLHDLAKGMETFLRKENITLPETCSLKSIAEDRDKGIIKNVTDICRRYPSEMMNAFYGVAGVLIATSAMRHRVMAPAMPGLAAHEMRELRKEGLLDVGLGSMTTLAGAISALVEEKKRDPDEPAARGIEKAWEWIREKPLRVAGYGYIASTLCHAGSTYIAYNQAKRLGDTKRLASVPYRAVFVGANLIAETLLAISSKGHGAGVLTDESVKDSIYALAAEMIVKQPAAQRDWHIQHVAGFLQQPDVLAESFQTVEAQLRRQVALLEKNPWAMADTAFTPAVSPQPNIQVGALTSPLPAPRAQYS